MKLKLPSKIRRTLTVAGSAVAAVLVLSSPSFAHEPVWLDSSDVLPWTAPLAADGTDMVGFMGATPALGAVRSAQFNMVAGQEIFINYLSRDAAPETSLSLNQFPVLFVEAPNGHIDIIEPDMEQVIGADEGAPPGFELLKMHEDFIETAPVTGTYTLVIVGRAPARFSIALGRERDDAVFHGLLRGTLATDAQTFGWFSTPPDTPGFY